MPDAPYGYSRQLYNRERVCIIANPGEGQRTGKGVNLNMIFI